MAQDLLGIPPAALIRLLDILKLHSIMRVLPLLPSSSIIITTSITTRSRQATVGERIRTKIEVVLSALRKGNIDQLNCLKTTLDRSSFSKTRSLRRRHCKRARTLSTSRKDATTCHAKMQITDVACLVNHTLRPSSTKFTGQRTALLSIRSHPYPAACQAHPTLCRSTKAPKDRKVIPRTAPTN